MQMQNGKISLRQYKRLLFFDMVGLGLVILPDLLARHAERAGGCSIGGVLSPAHSPDPASGAL